MPRVMTELYRPKPSWTALAPAARREFLQNLVAALAPVLESGASAIALGAADAKTEADAEANGYRFFALWRLRDQAASDDMIRISQAAGWYDYFEQVNVSGDAQDFEAVLLGNARMARPASS